jgi:transcriptional activator of glycolytic enzymes GCR1
MRRDISTVRQLYQEWTVGLNHCLPVGELDRRYGNRWRAGRGDEIQFYSLRVEIMRDIRRIADVNGLSEATAMERLQGRQDREKWTLDKLCKRLRLEAKQRGDGRKR